MTSSFRVADLGHVVLRVSDFEAAEAFYADLLGIPVSARAPEWSMTFFTLGEHHDFAITCESNQESVPGSPSAGLDHVAFRVDGGVDALRAAKRELEAAGVEVAAVDHVVTKSLYFRDPAGNGVELYVNGDRAWRSDPDLILSEAKALEL